VEHVDALVMTITCSKKYIAGDTRSLAAGA
jgi:hypothetical protein